MGKKALRRQGGWKPGRRKPYKFTKEKQEEFLRLTQEGQRRSAAARAIGLRPQTVSYHAIKYPAFAKALDEAEREATEQVEDALFQSALGGNVTAQQVWLYNRAPDRWRDARYNNVKVDANITGGVLLMPVPAANADDWLRQTQEEKSP